MDLRYAFLIFWGVIGVVASFITEPGYSEAWLFIGVVALGWAAVVAYRNWRRGPAKRRKH